MMVLDSGDDVDPMDMTAYSDAVSSCSKVSSGTKGKKIIQVFVSKMICHKSEPGFGVYAIIINFCETV